MLRKIIEIDESKCDGCGNCVPECHEGALQIIDGKARLISDLFCDGLGACIGHCPQDAMKVIEREAEPYDEMKVMDYIVKGGPNVIKAHLEHLREHEEYEYLKIAVNYLKENELDNPVAIAASSHSAQSHHGGCPGSKSMSFEKSAVKENEESGSRQSQLRQWPIQLHLVPPTAPYYKNSHLLLTADCVGFAYGDFHKDFMKEKSIAIACPKLDSNKQVYVEKLISMINDAQIQSITALIMQVPCCGGLLQMAQHAVESAERKVPLKVVVIGINGEVLNEAVVN
ncbi:MAG: 4Fe-4S binding protein [Bacteroidota bacterium]|nr:4Fe-4S binding protein [Bacteroidota bacterium]